MYNTRSLTTHTNRLLQQSLNDASNVLHKSHITCIHPEVFLKYSSVNVFMGKQGTGKTFTLMKELVKLSLIDSEQAKRCEPSRERIDVHLIVMVTRDGRQDDTLESVKDNITIPCVYVSYDNVVEYLHELVFYKLVYNKIISEHLEDSIDNEQRDEVLEALHIDSFSRQSLQEVIVFDDAAYSAILSKPGSEVTSGAGRRAPSSILSMIHEARHYKFIFCFCIQGVKSIPLPIKEQMTTLFLFPGFIRQKLFTIYNQSGITSLEYDEFRDLYHNLQPRDYLLVDCQRGTVKVVNGDLRK